MTVKDDIKTGARLIRAGKLVAFPTDTVYGLGANALDPIAVARIFELKQRPSFDPLIVHVAEASALQQLVLNPDFRVFRLAERFWPGPLTMVLAKSPIIPEIVTSGLPSVGIRIPDNELALQLIRESRCPIAAPSANRFGRVSPTTAEHVRKQLPGVDYILDGGKTSVGIESTIIKITDQGFIILRNGVITREEIEAVLPYDNHAVTGIHKAPGMLDSHYSPGKPFLIATNATLMTDKSRAGLISFSGTKESGFGKIIRVSESGDLKEYAANIFAAMHVLEDDESIDLILAEPVFEAGIGLAIMDRLRKAEYKWRIRLCALHDTPAV
jgi:L-threonylcarbamoyladenylate synthase